MAFLLVQANWQENVQFIYSHQSSLAVLLNIAELHSFQLKCQFAEYAERV